MAKSISRRRLLQQACAGWLLFAFTPSAQAAGTRFAAVRIWPGRAYTRITLEADAEVKYKYFMLDNPSRLVVDIQGAVLNEILSNISKKIQAADPYIANIRTGQKDSDTVRVVVNLKTAVNPQVFTLAPVAGFRHRLVIDLYPKNTLQDDDDPLMALLNGKISADNQPQHSDSPSADTRGSKRRPIIMLDPGHGGEDPGASSAGGLREKDVVLIIARETRKLLEAQGYKVLMTRNEDVFIPLKERTNKARRAHADLFVSIHADAFTNPSARGTGVFVLSKTASSASAGFLADSQNEADRIGGIKSSGSRHVDEVLLDMVQHQTITDSLRLGKLVLGKLGRYNKLHRGEVERANFAVLRSPEIPSILVETAFLSNPEEAKLLASGEFRQKVAQSISEGIRQYLASAVLASR